MSLRAKAVDVEGTDYHHSHTAARGEFFTIQYLERGGLAVVKHRRRLPASAFAITASDEIETTMYAPGQWIHVTGGPEK
jgi:hypothetical protein